MSTKKVSVGKIIADEEEGVTCDTHRSTHRSATWVDTAARFKAYLNYGPIETGGGKRIENAGTP